MEKNLNLNKDNIFEFTIGVVIIYCFLSIIRSVSLLYIAFTDDYFYNFDFNINSYLQKNHVFNNAYYYCPYIAGFFISFFFKRIIKLNWQTFIGCLILGFVLFRLMDSTFIRSLFGFFENSRMNIVFHLSIFLPLELFLIMYRVKRGNVSD